MGKRVSLAVDFSKNREGGEPNVWTEALCKTLAIGCGLRPPHPGSSRSDPDDWGGGNHGSIRDRRPRRNLGPLLHRQKGSVIRKRFESWNCLKAPEGLGDEERGLFSMPGQKGL